MKVKLTVLKNIAHSIRCRAGYGILVVTCLVLTLAFSARSAVSTDGTEVPLQPSPPTLATSKDFQTDPFTGTFSYSIPIVPAPARQGTEPKLSLAYNSGSGNGWCGVGWNVGTSSIGRDASKGVPIKWGTTTPLTEYDDAKGFVLNFGGSSSKLVNVAQNEYKERTDKAALTLTVSGNTWVVKDKAGTIYRFGESAASRMENSKWNSDQFAGTFRWALSSVEDVNGNKTTYEYVKDGGNLYLLRINYNLSTASPGLPANKIEFTLQDRTDKTISFRSGYRVEVKKLLQEINVYAGSSRARRYFIEYSESPSTFKSLLHKVTVYDAANSLWLKPHTFTYQEKPSSFATYIPWPGGHRQLKNNDDTQAWDTLKSSYGGGGDSGNNSTALDIDGDGLPDHVATSESGGSVLKVQRNTGAGFYPEGTSQNWGPTAQSYLTEYVASPAYKKCKNDFYDINGDGLPDFVSGSGSSDGLQVKYNNGIINASSWATASTTFGPLLAEAGGEHWRYIRIGSRREYDLIDLNGDGLGDRVMMQTSNNDYDHFKVQFNTGAGFSPLRDWWTLDTQGHSNGDWGALSKFNISSDEPATLIDLNGDGLADRVMRNEGSDHTKFVVQFNNGAGFECNTSSPEFWGTIDLQGATGTANDWRSPTGYEDNYCVNALMDINGDGLPDRVMRPRDGTPSNELYVQINTGSGFSETISWTIDAELGTGLQAWGTPNAVVGSWMIQFIYYSYTGIDMMDMNGDGLVDRVFSDLPRDHVTTTLNTKVSLNVGGIPDLLRQVDNGIGGRVEITYKPSTQYNNRDKDWTTDPWAEGAKSLLGFPVQTVATVTTYDGLGNSSLTSYSYKGGFYHTGEREFRGFCYAEITDPLNAKTCMWFHQGGGRVETARGENLDAGTYAKMGIPFRVETRGNDNRLYKLALNKVEEVAVPGATGAFLPFTSKTVELEYAGGALATTEAQLLAASNFRARATSQSYDAPTGNLLCQTNHGEIQLSGLANFSWPEMESKWSEIGSDEVYATTAWHGVSPTAALSNSAIRDKPSRTITTSDCQGTLILQETLFNYYGSTGGLMMQRDRICAGSYATNGFTYDVYGNVEFHTNEVNVITKIVYETETQTFPRQTIIDPFSASSFVTTNYHDVRSGLVTGTIEPSGLGTTNLYDEFFRLKETRISSAPNISADIWEARYGYRLDGFNGFGQSQNYVVQTNNNALAGDPGHETWTYSDGLGRTIQTRVESEAQTGYSAPFRVTDFVYDKRGQVIHETLPYFSEGRDFTILNTTKVCTWTEYDPLGRLWRTSPRANVIFANGLPSGTPTIPTGDAASPMNYVEVVYSEGTDPWVLTVKDEESHPRKFKLNAYGQTNQIVEINGAESYTTTYTHDLLGRLTRITDHLANVVEWAYDDLGRQVAMSDPHLGVWTYARDLAGRVRVQTDGRGNRIESFYTTSTGQQDPLGRMLKKVIYDATGLLVETVTYRYDSSDDPANYTVYKGQLGVVSDGQGWEKQSYDVRGRVKKTTRWLMINNSHYTTLQTYDDANRVLTTTYPGNAPVILNTYNTGGQLTTVQRTDASPITYFTSKGYNEFGQTLGSVYGNGTETTLSYFTSSKRLSELRTFKGTSDLQKLQYEYTAANNVRKITDLVRPSGSGCATISATEYDDLHRLKSVAGPGFGTFNFTYDAIGDMTLNGEAGTGSYSYGSVRPQAVKLVNGVTYAYDLCGNMTVRGGQRLTYDAQNHLSAVAANGVTLATFGYADGGERLWKQTAAGLQIWIGALYEVHNGVPRFHVLAAGIQVCEVEPTTGTTHYSHGDHLGSASLLTDATGVETRHWEYTPFGRERYPATTQSFAVSHRFTGQMLDDETGLYYYGARYYDPNLARFIQADSVIADFSNPQALNRYAYVLNNPLKYVDPTGHDWREAFGAVSQGFGMAQSMNPTTAPVYQFQHMYDRFVRSGYLAENGIWDSWQVAVGDQLGTTKYAEGKYGIDQITGRQLSGFESGYRKTMGGVQMASWLLPFLKFGRVAETAAAESGLAGSIRNVNPTGGGMNCANCAVAADATLAGNAASALPGGKTYLSVLEDVFGGSFQPVSGPMQIGSTLSQSGNGARGIVFGESLKAGQPGHVFNVINQRGTIRFLDAQVGGLGVSNFKNLQNFKFLLTHPGTP